MALTLSIIVPTYNNCATLRDLLNSLKLQSFSENNYEILIIDGGSKDKTLDIAKDFSVKILNNPCRVEEKARIIGLNSARGDILCFIDADNIILEKDWLEKMLLPFDDHEIVFSETLFFYYEKNNSIGVRYQALIGGDDPIAVYLGITGRWCYFRQDWTTYPYEQIDCGGYLKVKMKDKSLIPAMGSNGFFVRKLILEKVVKDTFIHSDVVYDLINNESNCFAKVKTGVVHNQPRFFPNKIRRIKRRLSGEVKINYNYGVKNIDIIRVMFYIIFIFPVLIDSIKGFIKKPDTAWFFHPIACFGEVLIIGFYMIRHALKKGNIKYNTTYDDDK